MKKIYYIIGSYNKGFCLGSISPAPELFSELGNNKQTMIKKKKELEAEYPDYLFYIGEQWKNKEGVDEILKLKKHWSLK